MLRVRAIFFSLCVSTALVLATGCALSTVSSSVGNSASQPVISGRVHGGQQAITGSTILLYAANTTANQGASTALLTAPVTTDSKGNFTITGLYPCPFPNSLLYIVASGGNPGGGTGNNSGIALMSILGTCSNFLANPANTFIFIDELTTVVSVQALAPFMTDYAHVGSAPTSISGVGGAFATAQSEFNFSTGQLSSTGASSVTLPSLNIDTLADILAACVNSAAGSAPCTTLYSNTGGATDTIGAALAMVKSPGQNTATLYGLITPNAPYQPYYTTAPTDFTSTVGFSVPSYIHTGVLDSNGQIWLYLGDYNYDPSTNTSTNSAGYIQVYDNNFSPLFTVNPGTGGLYYPDSMAADASGHVFAINANNTISEFSSTGAAISPAAGWPTGLPSTYSPTGTGNGYVYNTNQGGPISVDSLGNIWGGSPFSATPGKCYFELSSSGSAITPATEPFCALAGVSDLNSGAVDGSGNAWAVGYTSIAKVDATGALVATAPVNPGCFYTATNISGPPTISAYEQVTQGLRYDHVHNQLWGYSEIGAGAITNAGVFFGCNGGPTLIPAIQSYTSTSTTPGSPYSAGSLLITNGVLDGAGNFWFASSGITATGVVGSTPGTFTGTATIASYLSEIAPGGQILTPFNASTQTYGLQPTGFGANVTVSATNALAYTGGDPSVSLLGVDRFGNIWAFDIQTNRLLKITGLAAANTVNY